MRLYLCNYIALYSWENLDSSMVKLVGGTVGCNEGASGDMIDF